MAASRYTREINLEDTNNVHSLGVLVVEPESRVLDVGCGAGHVGAALRERGCRVWGIEVDADAARTAEAHYERVVVGDVETLDVDAEFGGEQFDAVLFLDVLEHLRQPLETLRRFRSVLADDGKIVASIPNATHATVKLELLSGRFRYRETGLLDRTHLRFFDADAVDALFDNAGFAIEERLRVIRQLDETEIKLDLETFSPEVLEAATADEEALTYQFFIVAVPTGPRPSPHTPDGATLLERLQRERDELKRVLAEREAAVAVLTEEHLAALRRIADEHDEELRRVVEERDLLRKDVEIKDEYIVELRRHVTGNDHPVEEEPRNTGFVMPVRYRVADAVYGKARRVPLVAPTLYKIALRMNARQTARSRGDG